MNKKSFTLLELLVVIAIIGVLAAMLLPATHKALQKAKESRAKAEMALLATTIEQVYSEVGYYVRLEDLAKGPSGTTLKDDTSATTVYRAYGKDEVRNWKGGEGGTQDDYTNQRSDNDAEVRNNDDAQSLWAGPYTTIKEYVIAAGHPQGIANVIGRPIDPWGKEYRMYWSINSSIKPAGASGTMIIISAGANKVLDTFGSVDPATATISAGTVPVEGDLYYNFNAGIQ